MHCCQQCGREWPENYCPECRRTIDKPFAASTPPPDLPGSPPPLAPAASAPVRRTLRRGVIIAGVIIAALLAGGLFAYHLYERFSFPPGYRNRPTAGWGVRIGEREFDSANRQIDSFNGTNAFGNSAEGVRLAREFSQILKSGRAQLFTPGFKLEILDHTKGEFMTYCELHSRECAFIVHVPQLRGFDTSVFEKVDARKLLAQLAWVTAQEVLKERGTTEPRMEIAVGLRGISQYGPIMIGNYDANAKSPQDGLVKYLDDGAQTHFLWTFFAPESASRSR